MAQHAYTESPKDNAVIDWVAKRQVYDVDLRLRAGVGASTADSVTAGVAQTGRPEDGYLDGQLVVAVPVVTAEQAIGVVRASVPESVVWRRVLAALAELALAGAVLVARRRGRVVTTPLEQLAATDRGVGPFRSITPHDTAGGRQWSRCGTSAPSSASTSPTRDRCAPTRRPCSSGACLGTTPVLPIYLLYPDAAALPAIARAVTGAYVPGPTLTTLLHVLRRITRPGRARRPRDPQTSAASPLPDGSVQPAVRP